MRYNSTLLSDNSLNQAATQINQGMIAQGKQGLMLQNYCQAISSQPFVNFGEIQKLQEIQGSINTGLIKAKEHADYYLGELQPQIIKNLVNIDAYYNLYTSVPTILPEGSSKDEWNNLLWTMKEQSEEYSKLALSTSDKIGVYYKDLSNDSQNFKSNVAKMNALVDGNEGVLKDLEKQIEEIDGEITGVIVGIVGSGLAIIGGIFITAVGAIGSFVTAGTSSALVVVGAGLIVAGVAGSVGFGVALANLLESKSSVLMQKSTLQAEVKAIEGISSSYNLLATQAGEAQKAAIEMKNAWEFLGRDLDVLAQDLNNGVLSTGKLRELWLTAANKGVVTVQEDVSTIKGQMTGVNTATAPNSEDLATFVRHEARSKSAADFPSNFTYWRAC